MSSRALRKLKGEHKKDDLLGMSNVNNQEQLSDDGEIPGDVAETRFNPFDLLVDEDENIESDDGQVKNEEQAQQQVPVVKKKKKKKKKKNKERTDVVNNKENKTEDEIDASMREVNAILGELPVSDGQSILDSDHLSMNMKALLAVEHKNLNPDNEMRRIFGSRVVQAEQGRQRSNQRRIPQRSTWLVRPKDSWPNIGKSGLSMDLLETRQGLQKFVFVHSKQYQQVEFQFLDAVESLNPQNIMDVLKVHPSHINSLLQLSEVCKMSEDIQMATDLIERALYVFETNFHSLFSLTQGNSRLNYKYPENRAFFLALFRHLLYVGQRGCYRTSLELSKLILSLDPDGDPLCVLLMIDFYALRAEQYIFLIRMHHEWESHRNLSQLPNFSYSVPLAMFHHCVQENMGTEPANVLLQSALLMFPSMLMPLLEKCSVQPDAEVTKCSFFNSQQNEPDALRMLIKLYIERCYSCWKEPEVVQWLESNVRKVIQRVNAGDTSVEENAHKRKTRYQGTPRNIYRHIIVSEIKEVTATLPPEIAHTPVLSYDPLPPTDSVTSYTRPEKLRRIQQESNPLSLFFRSLLPNFNPQELADEQRGAVGGEGQDLRQGVGALMNAMRELLNNIQPVAPPVENEENVNGEGEGGDIDEWD